MNNALYDRLLALPIADLAPVFDNGVRGRTMSSSSCSWLLPKVREAGVKTVIDLRTADHTDKFCKKVHDAGLAYRHIAIDSKNTDVREIIASLFDFFAWLDEGDFYPVYYTLVDVPDPIEFMRWVMEREGFSKSENLSEDSVEDFLYGKSNR